MDTPQLIDAMAGLVALVIGLWTLSAAVWVNLSGLNGRPHRRHVHFAHHAPLARH